MFVGLDVHKETIDVSIAQEGQREGEVRHYGVIASDLEPLDNVVRAPDRRLHFVYEAGPCGFGIYRHLTAHGEDCVVVSRPHQPGKYQSQFHRRVLRRQRQRPHPCGRAARKVSHLRA